MKLPSAPLIEVVFELRWRIENTGDVFGYDPGFPAFSRAFKERMQKVGYTTYERVSPPGPTFAYQVIDRFRKAGAFPLLQIGSGIFACNASTDYDWQSFRALIEEGVRALSETYPDTSVSPLDLMNLELRYIDVFNESLIGSLSWTQFVEKWTNLDFKPLPYLEKVAADGTDQVNFALQQGLKDKQLGFFDLHIANGQSFGKPSILMTSKVKRDFANDGPARQELPDFCLKWSEAAHSVTHDFFEAVIHPDLMAKFKQS